MQPAIEPLKFWESRLFGLSAIGTKPGLLAVWPTELGTAPHRFARARSRFW